MKDTTRLCLISPVQGTLIQLILGISFVGIALFPEIFGVPYSPPVKVQ